MRAGPGTLRPLLSGQWARVRHSVAGLLLHPGQLTAEFRDRQRARSVAPWRLAFNAVTLFFVLSFVTDFHVARIAELDASGTLSAKVEQTVQRTQLARELVVERAERRFNALYTALLTLSIGTYTLLVGLTHRRSRQPWSVHAVFALHFVAWIFLVSIALYAAIHALRVGLLLPAPVLQQAQNLLGLGVLAFAVAYLTAAFRRVYAEGILPALCKGIVVIALGSLVDSAVLVSAFELTIASL